MTSLNQEFLDKEDKKGNVYLNTDYAQLRVDIFKMLNDLSYDSEKRVSLITEDILDIVDNYRDESFILQFMSPKIIRDFKLFLLDDTAGNIEFKVNAIHNTRGYKIIRKELARQQEYNYRVPNIQIIDCDLLDTRDLILGYRMSDGKELHEKDMEQVLLHVKQIWGYDIILELWKDGEKIGQKSTDATKIETTKNVTNPFAYGMFARPGYI